MIIGKNTVIAVNYHLTCKEGDEPEELVEQTSDDKPFVFLFGAGGVLPDFEKNLEGKKVGDKFDFRVESSKAYGNYEEEYVADIPKQAFFVEGEFDEERVKVDAELPMLDSEGNQMYGIVVEVTDDMVIMDFNHPLAGNDLHFVGEVLEVRVATEDEIKHNHVHGAGGHHH